MYNGCLLVRPDWLRTELLMWTVLAHQTAMCHTVEKSMEEKNESNYRLSAGGKKGNSSWSVRRFPFTFGAQGVIDFAWLTC